MKWQNRIAQSFGPGLSGCKTALKAFPTRRKRGAIPTGRNSPVLQNSITPLTRNRGRGRRRRPERGASRVTAECCGYERGNGLGRMDVLEETHTYRSPLSGRIVVRDQPRAKALGYSVLPFHGKGLSGRNLPLNLCRLTRQGVRRNPAALDYTSLPGPDPAPIFQGHQTDAHDDELAGDKGEQRTKGLIHESV